MEPMHWRPDWVFVMTTLFIRLFGVFVVLAILQIVVMFVGYIFKRFAGKSEPKTDQVSTVSFPSETLPPGEEVNEQEVAAAIGAALSLYESEAESAVTFSIGGGLSPQSSDWTIMGRMAQLRSRVFQGRHQ